ncbi:MAG: preprotein translocase subunit YajC [Candidatus Dasytiphilus stammeri]
MNFFISNVQAATNFPPIQENYFSFIIMLISMGLIFYFLILRPQTKRIQEHKKIIESLTEGDEIMTTTGIVGRIMKINKNGYIILSLNKITPIIIKQDFVAAILPTGTIKSLNVMNE